MGQFPQAELSGSGRFFPSAFPRRVWSSPRVGRVREPDLTSPSAETAAVKGRRPDPERSERVDSRPSAKLRVSRPRSEALWLTGCLAGAPRCSPREPSRSNPVSGLVTVEPVAAESADVGIDWNPLAAIGTGHPRVSGVAGLVADVRAASPGEEESEEPAEAGREAEAAWVLIAERLDDLACSDGRQNGQPWAPDRGGLEHLGARALQCERAISSVGIRLALEKSSRLQPESGAPDTAAKDVGARPDQAEHSRDAERVERDVPGPFECEPADYCADAGDYTQHLEPLVEPALVRHGAMLTGQALLAGRSRDAPAGSLGAGRGAALPGPAIRA
jgi:hypothetical protein